MPSTKDPKPPESVDISGDTHQPRQPTAETALQNNPETNQKTIQKNESNAEAASIASTQGKPNPNSDVQTPDAQIAKEYGGPAGLEPTRYGDWEKNGRCSDF